MTTTASSNIKAGQQSAQKVPLGATVNIPPRRLDFQFDDKTTTRYFYDNDPFLSAFWLSLSALFPEGEAFFVDSVRHYRKEVTDAKLKAQVAGFIGQEAMHSKEHEAWNEMGVKFGYPTDKLDKSLGKLLGLVQNSLIAAAVLGLVGGIVGVFVMQRDMAFAVHGVSELSFAGAAAALLFGGSLIRACWRQAREYDRYLREQIEQQQTAETVKLLLHEYEASASDWLWEVDEGNCLVNVCERFGTAARQDRDFLEGRELVGLFKCGPAREKLAALMLECSSFRDLVVEVDLAGEARWWSISGNPTSDGTMRGVMRDVTDSRKTEQRVAHMARYDTLSGLANRHLFNETLDDMLGRQVKNQQLALLYIDLDHFKSVNDTLGHHIGDELIRVSAARLSAIVREHDLAARLGGDEFAVLLTRVSDLRTAHICAQRIVDAMAEPFNLMGQTVRVSASVGVAYSPTRGLESEEFMRQADLALYAAKRAGRSTYADFDAALNLEERTRRDLELDLRTAIAEGQFTLVYQPQVCLKTGKWTGKETLVRWQHPVRGRIMPVEFIGIAEETGLIIPLGEWIIRQAIHEAARWEEPHTIAINLSPIQMRNPNLVNVLTNAIGSAQIEPERVEIEITENALMHDSEANVELLHRLRKTGVRIALDDFGTGYSSLNYLRAFPFDKIKIDRCFVSELLDRSDCQAIVRNVIMLARALGMETTAEGVETREQYEWLKLHGCTEAQGYYISRPMEAADAAEASGALSEWPAGEVIADNVHRLHGKVA